MDTIKYIMEPLIDVEFMNKPTYGEDEFFSALEASVEERLNVRKSA